MIQGSHGHDGEPCASWQRVGARGRVISEGLTCAGDDLGKPRESKITRQAHPMASSGEAGVRTLRLGLRASVATSPGLSITSLTRTSEEPGDNISELIINTFIKSQARLTFLPLSSKRILRCIVSHVCQKIYIPRRISPGHASFQKLSARPTDPPAPPPFFLPRQLPHSSVQSL
jgi:hypothetical protein